MLCIILLLSINPVYAQGKGIFFFFDEGSKEPYNPHYITYIKIEGEEEPKAYEERKVKNGILFFIQDISLFHRNGMEQKKVDTTFLKGEDILNASEVAKFLDNVVKERYKEAGSNPFYFVYNPDPPMCIVNRPQDEYHLYEVEFI